MRHINNKHRTTTYDVTMIIRNTSRGEAGTRTNVMRKVLSVEQGAKTFSRQLKNPVILEGAGALIIKPWVLGSFWHLFLNNRFYVGEHVFKFPHFFQLLILM